MDADSMIVKGDGHLETLAGSEIVLMRIEDGKFFTLSGTARRAWEMMDGPLSIEALAERLTRDFAVEKEACVGDLLQLCRDLEKHGLIDVRSTASA